MAIYGNFQGTTKSQFQITTGGGSLTLGASVNEIVLNGPTDTTLRANGIDFLTSNGATFLVSDATGITLSATATGAQKHVDLQTNSAVAGTTTELRFRELTSNGTDYVALKAPDALPASTTYVLPTSDGSPENWLITDGAGNTSWGGPVYLSAYNTNTVTINNAGAAVPIDTVDQISNASHFTVGTNSVTVNVSGVYVVTFTIFYTNKNNARTNGYGDLRINTVIVPNGRAVTYNRGQGVGIPDSTASKTLILRLNSGDVVDILGTKNGGNLTTVANQNVIVFQRIAP